MKQRTYIQCLAGIGALVLGAVIWLYVAFSPAGKDATSSVSPDLIHRKARGGADRPGSRAGDLPSDEPRGHKPRTASNDGSVHLMPGQVLAMVNKEPIEARHLVPIREGDTENVLTKEEYSSRLQRAVDMEIVLQAALAEKVELTEAQKARVDGIAEGEQAEMDHYKKFGLSWKSTGAEHVEFEKRLLNAQLLEQNLVAKKSEVGPSTDPEIQSRYEEARVELLAQLHGQADIDILAPDKAK